jgi:hypothetical protein
MNQALENIRNRIDAFGTAEPLLFVTGNTIEVQIPGLARGTIRGARKKQFCIADDQGQRTTCFPTQDAADAGARRRDRRSRRVVRVPDRDRPTSGAHALRRAAPCAAREGRDQPRSTRSTVKKQQGQFCSADTGSRRIRATRRRQAEQACRLDRDADVAELLHPGTAVNDAHERPRCRVRARSQSRRPGSCLDGMTIKSSDTQFCVVSSAAENLGCFLDRDSAEARLQETGRSACSR